MPSFLTKETTQAELQNPAKRTEIAWELSTFFMEMVDEELDAEGKISFDFKDELVKISTARFV